MVEGIYVYHSVFCTITSFTRPSPLSLGIDASIFQRHGVDKEGFGKGVWIATAVNLDGGDGLADLVVVVLGDVDVEGGHVLVKVLDPRRAGDGEDVVALGHEEGQHQLPGRAALGVGQGLELVHQLQVPGEVLLAEARRLAAEIARLKVVATPDGSRQEAPPQR